MTEHARYDAIYSCHSCQIPIQTKELFITCDTCDFVFHKKCTEQKKLGGHWKPNTWNCQSCGHKNSNEVPAIVETAPEVTNENNDMNLPKKSGKHRKSNAASCQHPEKEFLESQINTLKSVVARREAELKKLQESDKLKAKRIMQLEAQLTEARKFGCIPNATPLHNTETRFENNENTHENTLLEKLNKKTTDLEQQMSLLLNKFENLEQSSTTSRDIFICDSCNVEFYDRKELNIHRETTHNRYKYNCGTCNNSFDTQDNLDEHRLTHTIKCQDCDFQTNNLTELKKHSTIHKFKCDECNYHAIHQRDLSRHKLNMHPQCNICQYKARNKQELQKHQENHMDLTLSCNICDKTLH